MITIARVYRRKNEGIDDLIKRFKTLCNKEGIYKAIKSREFYRTPKQIKLEKMLRNQKNKNKNMKGN